MIGDYVPGTSVFHRMGAGRKLLSLVAVIILVTVLPRTPLQAGLCVVALLLCLAVARIPVTTAWSQLWPPLPVLAFLAAFQWRASGWQAAAITLLTIYAAIIAAVLVTLTTPVARMMDALDKAFHPLARFGFPAENVSLAVSLTIRLIPLMGATVREVMDARKARGASLSLLAFGTPVVIRAMRRAQGLGEALAARGVAD